MTTSSGKAGLQGIRLSQELLHARPTLARRLFWRAPAVPVSFKADGVVIAVAFQGPELPRPVNDPISHRRPIITFCAFDRVLAVAVADTIFGQKIVAIGKRKIGRASCRERVKISD